MRYVALHLLGKTQVKGISVQNTGENIWTTEERMEEEGAKNCFIWSFLVHTHD